MSTSQEQDHPPDARRAAEFLDRARRWTAAASFTATRPSARRSCWCLRHRLRPPQRAVPRPGEPVLDPAAGVRRRHARHRPDPHDPHRGHRPIGRGGDDPPLDGHGPDDDQKGPPPCSPCSSASSLGSPPEASTACSSRGQAASVHRHAGHVQHLRGRHPAVLARRDHPPSRHARGSSRGPGLDVQRARR